MDPTIASTSISSAEREPRAESPGRCALIEFTRRIGLRVASATAALVVWSAAMAPADAATPVPPWNETHVSTAGFSGSDTFLDENLLAGERPRSRFDRRMDALREFLAEFESSVGAEYHIAVVPYSSPQNQPGPRYSDSAIPYVDDVYAEWSAHVDPRRDVVIAMAIENRGIAIHPGSRWSGLGFQTSAIKRTIDQSQFASNARSQDYAGALEALVRATDRELRRREQMAEAQKERLLERRKALESELEDVRDMLERTDSKVDPRRLDEVPTLLEDAAISIQRDDLSTAKLSLSRAVDAIDAVRNAHEEIEALEYDIESAIELAEETRETVARSEAEVDTGPLDEALELLEGARAHIPDDVSEASRKVAEARDRIRSVDEALSSAEAWHFVTWRVLPALLILLLLAALAFLGWSAIMRKRRRKRRADGLLDEWSEAENAASERLLSLETQQPYLMLVGTDLEGYEASTRERIEQVGTDVDWLFLAFAAMRERLDRARETHRREEYLETISLLVDQDVEVTTRKAPEHELFVPEREPELLAPDALRREMQSRYEDVRARLARLEADIVDATETSEALAAARDELDGEHHELELAGAELRPDAPITDAIGAIDETLAAMERDPLGHVVEAREHLEWLERHRRRVANLIAIQRFIAEEVSERVDAIRTRIQRLGEDGIDVIEPGFEPETTLEHVGPLVAATQRAIDRLDEAGAEEAAGDLRDLLDTLGLALDRIVTTRDDGGERVEALRRRCETLREDRPAVEKQLSWLAERHPVSALQPVHDNIQEIDAAFEAFEDAVAKAQIEMSDDVGHYLAADELLRGAEATLDEIARLDEEVEQKEQEIAWAKRQSEQLIDSLTVRRDTMRELLDADSEGPFLQMDTRTELEELVDGITNTISAADAEQVDWIEMHRRLRLLDAPSRHALADAEEAEAARRWIEAERDAIEKELRDVESLLEESRDDRAAANEQLETARAAWQAATAELDVPRCDCPRAKTLLRRTRTHAREADRMARADISAAERARKSLQTAVQERYDLRQARYASYADTIIIANMIDRANRLLVEHRYEEAAEKAREAIERIESEDDAAKKAAEDAWKSRKSWTYTSPSFRSSSSSSSSSSSFFSSSSSSSWSSSSSSSSWSSSSSSGSSWGSSSSGGSSWGSSSSGGSSW